MSEEYIRTHFDDITGYENVIEKRLADSDFSTHTVIEDNHLYFQNCVQHNLDYIIIDKEYDIERYCSF